MKELSVTITFGMGNEAHNHDLEYRETLEHVHAREDGVVELLPYRPYRDQINELMRPYIDEYNAERDRRLQAAWDRYNAGELKTKPRKRDYKHMAYDYYSQHENDEYYNQKEKRKEPLPIFRSIILGIGDKADRKKGRITEAQAIKIFREAVADFQKDNPALHVLGAAVHLDEVGFYHCHLDFKPLYDKTTADSRGLSAGISFEEALEQCGYSPEQSIINGRDKAPIRFNGLRNKMHRNMERAMAGEGLRMQYGVSAQKEPGKDSSHNQALEDWQAIQDAARDLQHQKNVALEVISLDEVSPEDLKRATAAVQRMANTLQEVADSPRTIDRKGYKVSFRLFDQLQTMLRSLQKAMAYLVHQIDVLKENLEYYRPFEQRAQKAEAEAAQLRRERFSSAEARSRLENENRRLQRENDAQRRFMETVKDREGRSMLDAYEARKAAQKRSQEWSR